jgi:hypothetical protein
MDGPSDMQHLSEKLGYENEVLRLIAVQTQAVDGAVEPGLIELVSRKRGAIVGAKVHITVSDSIGSGQVGRLLDSISALAFLSCFKILDAIVEWILEYNFNAGALTRLAWRFEDKVCDIHQSKLLLPSLLNENDWLRRMTFALYENLLPFRHEIVHRHSYQVSDGVLVVVDTKSDDRGELRIDRHRLGSLARFVIGLGACLTGKAPLDQHMTLRMRYYTDQIADIHGAGVFDQKEPLVVNVKLSVPEEEGTFAADLGQVRQEVQRIHPGRDVLFNLVLCATRDDDSVWKWEIPYDAVPSDTVLVLDEQTLPKYRVSID